MGLPSKLKNFNFFNDGNSYVGICPEVVLPKLMRKTEEYRGGGMNGDVTIDQGMQGMSMEITTGFMPEIYRSFGSANISGRQLRWVGAYQRDDTGVVDAVEVSARGRFTEIDPGNAKAGEDAGMKTTVPLTYYRLTINGRVEIEIDLLNFIETIDGVDRLAEQRKAIGV
ncbi:phage major tail tube protein [Methyloversatilis sp.]|uniref:phage major tail tube protein n=1 Tax=Methyloversatilis sp. TaxID=2569862 RepID=UPI0027351143|nr:phage major tail tube protein [Methyloversatilis sp.]MDP3579133.1 phage major tail tube protein [Methyloversatilis sp.]